MEGIKALTSLIALALADASILVKLTVKRVFSLGFSSSAAASAAAGAAAAPGPAEAAGAA